MMISIDLEGKVAVVTCSAQGIRFTTSDVSVSTITSGLSSLIFSTASFVYSAPNFGLSKLQFANR